MFPQGGPGVGLLLLRLAAAGMFTLNVTQRFNSSPLYWPILLVISLVSLSLLLGFLTPIVSIITCLAALANLLLPDQSIDPVYVVRILTSGALFFLGPGAYSVDAKLFGLRVTVVTPRKDKKSTTTVN